MRTNNESQKIKDMARNFRLEYSKFYNDYHWNKDNKCSRCVVDNRIEWHRERQAILLKAYSDLLKTYSVDFLTKLLKDIAENVNYLDEFCLYKYLFDAFDSICNFVHMHSQCENCVLDSTIVPFAQYETDWDYIREYQCHKDGMFCSTLMKISNFVNVDANTKKTYFYFIGSSGCPRKIASWGDHKYQKQVTLDMWLNMMQIEIKRATDIIDKAITIYHKKASDNLAEGRE